jgi:hypothetical protein
MFKEIFSLFYDVLVLNVYFSVCPTARSGFRYCCGLRAKEGSESKTHHLEFLSSQADHPTCGCCHCVLSFTHSLAFKNSYTARPISQSGKLRLNENVPVTLFF